MIALPLDPTGKPERPGDRMNAVISMTDLTPTERLLLSALAFHDGPGGAHPSAASLAERFGISRDSVFGHLKRIVAKGRLTRLRGKHANTYEIAYDPRPHCREIPDSVGRNVTRHSVGKLPATVSGNPRHEPEEPEAIDEARFADPGEAGRASSCSDGRIGEIESVSASAPDPTRAAAEPVAHTKSEAGEETDREPFQTSIIHVVPDAPHDPGPQPSPAHRLHGCTGPCDTLRWEIGDRSGHSHCPACRRTRGTTPQPTASWCAPCCRKAAWQGNRASR